MAQVDLSKLRIDKSRLASSKGKTKKFSFRSLTAVFMLGIVSVFLLKKIFIPVHQVDVAAVSQVYPSQSLSLLNASGYVVAQRKAALASKITGRIISLSVEEGSGVKKGQIIARLEDQDARASRDKARAKVHVARSRFEQAQAELYEAALAFDRDGELLDRGFVSQAEYDTSLARYRKELAAVAAAEAEVKASNAALVEAEVSLGHTLIRAPFDAVVLTKRADIGDIISPLGAAAEAKTAIVTIADMSSLQVEADVSESNLEKVRVGQPCEIQLEALPDSRFRGLVHLVVPTIDRAKATVMVKVQFVDKDRRILPEMSAKVSFLSRPLESDELSARTVLSSKALMNRQGRKVVYLVKGDQAVEAPVTIGGQFGDFIEVLHGVKPGDRVIIQPMDGLMNAIRIKIKEK
ncbi:MAG: efflux RND transporter periplasmic adaptor subunit [bacterium]